MLVTLCCLAALSPAAPADGEPAFLAGFAKVDVTPEEPLRLSGYGDRAAPFAGIDTPIFVRAMALRPRGGAVEGTGGGDTFLLVSVDTIGTTVVFTEEIAGRIEREHGVPRARFVLCGTHSHTTPHLAGGLSNLFAVPLTDEERAGAERYTAELADRIVAAAGDAIDDLRPATLATGTGDVGFAVNRRLLKDGKWIGFGVNPDGPVDHALPVLRVADPDGALRGVVFNYACHATTLTGSYNRLTGDWPGYAARDVEEANPGTVALCTIGAGADANPEPRGKPEHAVAHGRAVARAVAAVLDGKLAPVTAAPVAAFGTAPLPYDRPDRARLKELAAARPQDRRYAEHMLEIYERKGRLPANYPAPVQTWRFGDSLTIVFLGGEVVVDYALRLKKELSGELVWVTAYANDVFAYVASDRILDEGGYEVTGSMIYYLKPGPWAAGVEDILVGRVKELLTNPPPAGPIPADDAAATFRLPPGFHIEPVAAEPLIADPVSFAFGADGRLWVVEMGDYPGPEHGGNERPGRGGGRVKVLSDVDRDGRFDAAKTFADGLPFPTGVLPWRDGVLVAAAPDVLFLADTDGDGRADRREVLYTGFKLANPQHRVNGFTIGLDNRVHVGSGDNNGEIKSTRTGEILNMSGRDLSIDPDTGGMTTTSGRAQFGRPRSDTGEWFANDNSRPLWHYVIEDRYLLRNPHVAPPDPREQLFDPPVSPRVFPAVAPSHRFNDLRTADRFTSACGPILFRDVSLGADFDGAALICEPVHNLAHRAMLESHGVTWRATRHPDERNSEFLTSTDPWCRPVRLDTGPDGALWLADMYRAVIEHPKWIPDEWLARLDVRAGHDRGRIYRVWRGDARPGPLPDLTVLADDALVIELRSPNGTRRDLAQRLLVERRATGAVPRLVDLARSDAAAPSRLHAVGTLLGLNELRDDLLVNLLSDDDPAVLCFTLRLAEPRFDRREEFGVVAAALAEHADLRVRFQTALSLGAWDDPRVGDALATIAARDGADRWVRTAVLSSAAGHADVILENAGTGIGTEFFGDLLATALAARPRRAGELVAGQLSRLGGAAVSPDTLERADAVFAAAGRGHVDVAPDQRDVWAERARRAANDADASPAERVAAVRLLGRTADGAEARDRLADLLAARHPPAVRSAAVRALADTAADDVPDRFLAAWPQAAPGLRGELLTELLNRPAWAGALLAAIEDGRLAAADVGAAARERLLDARGGTLRTRAAAVFGPASVDTADVLERAATLADLPADPGRGRVVFKRVCATCHQLGGVGEPLGPNLAALTDRSTPALLAAILDPDRAIEDRYRRYVAVTEDGRSLSGMLLSESAAAVTLAQADGRTVTVRRSDLLEFAGAGTSFMPTGLHRTLSDAEFADLLAFVRVAE